MPDTPSTPKDPKQAPRYCAAKTRAGGTCKRYPVEGKRRCKLHGGDSTGPKNGHRLYAMCFDPAEQDVANNPDVHQAKTFVETAAAILHRALMRGEHDVADRMLGRIASLGQLALQQASAAKEQATGERVLMIELPVVSKTAEEWIQDYGKKPDPDELD